MKTPKILSRRFNLGQINLEIGRNSVTYGKLCKVNLRNTRCYEDLVVGDVILKLESIYHDICFEPGWFEKYMFC